MNIHIKLFSFFVTAIAIGVFVILNSYSNQITYISTIIATQNSSLKLYKFSNLWLLDECYNEVYTLLAPPSFLKYRNLGWFSDEHKGYYKYGDQNVARAQKLPVHMKKLLSLMNSHFNTDANGILVNHYKNGSEFIHQHADSKNYPEEGVFIISYGTTRQFQVYNKLSRELIANISLIHGEMVQMSGNFQMEFTHGIAKELSVATSRYSFNFHKYIGKGLH